MSSDIAVDPTNMNPIVIRPTHGWRTLGLGEVWEYRELLYFLAWRDVKIRYKQTALGVAWVVLQPLLTMAVFSLFFGRLARLPSDGAPYPLFAFCGILPWQLFAYALTQSSNSLIEDSRLISKVYFPRLIVPIASVLAGLVDFVVAFLLLIVVMLVYGIYPSLSVLFLPIFVLLAVASALAVGSWLSALNVKYRDVRYTIPFLTQLWLFATPVVYPTSIVPEKWRWLFGINPMAGVVEGFRWALLGTGVYSLPIIVVSTGMAFMLLLGGVYYFRRTERMFADLV